MVVRSSLNLADFYINYKHVVSVFLFRIFLAYILYSPSVGTPEEGERGWGAAAKAPPVFCSGWLGVLDLIFWISMKSRL